MGWTRGQTAKRKYWTYYDYSGTDVARIVLGLDGTYRMALYGSESWTCHAALKQAKREVETTLASREIAYRMACSAIVEADKFGSA